VGILWSSGIRVGDTLGPKISHRRDCSRGPRGTRCAVLKRKKKTEGGGKGPPAVLGPGGQCGCPGGWGRGGSLRGGAAVSPSRSGRAFRRCIEAGSRICRLEGCSAGRDNAGIQCFLRFEGRGTGGDVPGMKSPWSLFWGDTATLQRLAQFHRATIFSKGADFKQPPKGPKKGPGGFKPSGRQRGTAEEGHRGLPGKTLVIFGGKTARLG